MPNDKEHDISIQTEEHGIFILLKLSGFCTARNLLTLRHAVEEAMGIGHINICLDMQHIRMLDSTGLGLLLNLSRNLAKLEGKLLILNASEQAQNVLSVSKTESIIRAIQGTLEDAEAYF